MKTLLNRSIAYITSLMVLTTIVAHGAVSIVRTPDNGIQPQAAIDGKGILHLIYFKGNPRGGDIYYVNSQTGGETFSEPIQVNNRAQCAMAIGTIRGAHLAIGKNERVHVAWMGTSDGGDSDSSGHHRKHPMLYTRLNDTGTSFEPERNLVTWAGGLDGGGSLGADSKGNVYVAWHGSAPDNHDKEFGRSVYVAHSDDEGKNFKKEKQAMSQQTGACGCCGMRAYVDSKDNFYVLYRTADKSGRDMALLMSSDKGKTFSLSSVNDWNIQACPMSSAAFGEGGNGILLGTERKGHIEAVTLDPNTMVQSSIGDALGLRKIGKYPSVSGNARGEVLLAWTEGGGWNKGGVLKWVTFDASSKLIEKSEFPEKHVDAWSFATTATKLDGTFLVIF